MGRVKMYGASCFHGQSTGGPELISRKGAKRFLHISFKQQGLGKGQITRKKVTKI